MRIASIKLKNFKRFTDLTVDDIPQSAKLVVVVGPNGCGKSSLFDALLQWYRSHVGFGQNTDDLYYRKDKDQSFQFAETVNVSLHSGATPVRGCLYVRTAYRNDPDFSISAISKPSIPTDTVRVNRAIENDQVVAENYQRLVHDTMSAVYDTSNDAKTVQVLREELIGQIRCSMKAVFPDLLLNNISDPLGSGTFYFEKGTAKNYHYKNLSGGEKAAFDLLLDLHVKKKFYGDAIYCVDELETHLHTKMQGRLLKEMIETLPSNAQLWVTTHSLGVIRAALEHARLNTGSVCVIDFDGANQDASTQLRPCNLGRIAWEKFLSIALDDLSKQVSPRSVIICEGSSLGKRRKDYDAEIYNKIFGENIPDVLFISGGSSAQVEISGVAVETMLSSVIPASKVSALIDRDDKSEEEVRDLRKNGTLVLSRRNLECYLFDDEVIKSLVLSAGKPELEKDALGTKLTAIKASIERGNPSDDMKSAAGETYVELKKLLGLTRCGNDVDSFMRDTLASLIAPTMSCYAELKTTIIDSIN